MVLGSGIRNPRSGIRKKTHSGSRIQGSKRHRIPDPDPQHWMGHYSWYCRERFWSKNRIDIVFSLSHCSLSYTIFFFFLYFFYLKVHYFAGLCREFICGTGTRLFSLLQHPFCLFQRRDWLRVVPGSAGGAAGPHPGGAGGPAPHPPPPAGGGQAEDRAGGSLAHQARWPLALFFIMVPLGTEVWVQEIFWRIRIRHHFRGRILST
jgi:hypothetical protein